MLERVAQEGERGGRRARGSVQGVPQFQAAVSGSECTCHELQPAAIISAHGFAVSSPPRYAGHEHE